MIILGEITSGNNVFPYDVMPLCDVAIEQV